MNFNFLIAGDFTPINEDFTFTATGVTRQCVNLVIKEDDVVENTEQLLLQLSSNDITASQPSVIIDILDSSRK